jgi:hypothetical protein
MFDVIWTDPNVEHMGQRKLRKEQEAKDKDSKRAESGRQSISTTSSSSSERGLGFFAPKSKRKVTTPTTRTNAGLLGQEDCDDVKANRASMYGVKAALADQDKFGVSPKPIEEPLLLVQPPELDDNFPTSPRGMYQISILANCVD